MGGRSLGEPAVPTACAVFLGSSWEQGLMCTAKLAEVHMQRESLGSWGAVQLCCRTRGTNPGSSHSRGSLEEE